jgi:hypothetical protein
LTARVTLKFVLFHSLLWGMAWSAHVLGDWWCKGGGWEGQSSNSLDDELNVKFLQQQKSSGKQRGNSWKVSKLIAQIHDAKLADQTAAFPRQSIVVLVPEHRSHRRILSLTPSDIRLCRGLSTRTESQPSVLKSRRHLDRLENRLI